MVHLAAYVIVSYVFALIERGETLADLLPEPLVMVKIAGNQLTHDFNRHLAGLRGDLFELGFQFARARFPSKYSRRPAKQRAMANHPQNSRPDGA